MRGHRGYFIREEGDTRDLPPHTHYRNLQSGSHERDQRLSKSKMSLWKGLKYCRTQIKQIQHLKSIYLMISKYGKWPFGQAKPFPEMFNLLERLKYNKKGLFCLFSHLIDSLHMHTALLSQNSWDGYCYGTCTKEKCWHVTHEPTTSLRLVKKCHSLVIGK